MQIELLTRIKEDIYGIVILNPGCILKSGSFVVQSLSHVRLCDPVDCSMPAILVLHCLLEVTQTHVLWIGDAIQPSHPLSFLSLPAFNLSQHQGLF